MRPSVWLVDDPAKGQTSMYREKLARIVFLLAHDLIGHPLIAVTGGALWAYRFHDFCSNAYEARSVGCYDRDIIVMEGTHEVLNPVIDVLESSAIAPNYKMTRHEDGTHIRFTVVCKPEGLE